MRERHSRGRGTRRGRTGARGWVLLRPATCRGLAVAALAAAAAACAPEPGEENLKASFAAQIEAVASVSGLERTGDALTFIQRREGDTDVMWRVTIDSVTLEPRPDDAVPVQGSVVSSWYADGGRIEPLGSMSRLPEEFLAAGVAQECWALWDAERAAWDW